MLSFENDYVEGAHELILQRLAETTWNSFPDTELIPGANGQRKRFGKPVNVLMRMSVSWWAAHRRT